MAKRNYHVVAKGKQWGLVREGGKRASSLHPTQRQAIKAGQKLAKDGKAEVVIHRPDGRIRDSDSYGNDPCPPRDKRH